MEPKNKFSVVDNGYSFDEVDAYIERVKTEYKKMHEFAKVTEANNNKLKNLCIALRDENNRLKAEAANAAPAAEEVKAIPEGTMEIIEKIGSLIAEIAKESDSLKEKLQ